MSDHTPEPWFATEHGQIATRATYVCHRVAPPDARRIVACVNFCAEVPMGSMEAATLRELMDALEAAGRRQSEWRGCPTWGESDEAAAVLIQAVLKKVGRG